MSRQEPKRKAAPPPARPADSASSVARSGAGAGSALQAMLRKRQMRATGDPEAEPPAAAPPEKSAGE